MEKNDPDLWGTFGFENESAQFDPRRELLAQATLLGKKTRGLITAEVITESSKKTALSPPTPPGAISAVIGATATKALEDALRTGLVKEKQSPLGDLAATNRILEAAKTEPADVFRHSFDLLIPSANYGLRLFVVEHFAIAPPVLFYSPLLEVFTKAETEEAFTETVRSILGNQATRLAIETLYKKLEHRASLRSTGESPS